MIQLVARQLVSTHQSHEEAKETLKADWKYHRTRDGKSGKREFFNCIFVGCRKRCYIAYNQFNVTVDVMTTSDEHEHGNPLIARQHGVNQATKETARHDNRNEPRLQSGDCRAYKEIH
jgi:hypothetical protein